MSNKPLLLAVDDEPLNLEILEEALDEGYRLEFAVTGNECLEKLKTLKPELILLDVNMPGITGIETCKKIKENPEVADIPVIFVSALCLPEERMNGYKVGGEDYITKPFEEEELLAKIELTLASQHKNKSLQQSSTDAISIAMTAMTQSGEISEVIQFTRNSYQCNTLEALAQLLLKSLNRFDLSATLRMTSNKQDYFFTSSGSVGEREQETMEHMREKGRFIHFGKRTLINFDNISILIKNMPIDDEARYGRMNDITIMLVEGADSRITGIDVSLSLVKLIDATRNVLGDIEVAHRENEQKNTTILDDLVERVNWAFFNMDLSEQQEDYFKKMLHQATEQSKALFDSDMKVEKKIENLIATLSIIS